MNAETYLALASLADLPAAESDELLEDLPGHLTETLAEPGGLACPLGRGGRETSAQVCSTRTGAGSQPTG